jgi:hypothetical protein
MRRIVLLVSVACLTCSTPACADLIVTASVPPGTVLSPGQEVTMDLGISGVTDLTYFTIALKLTGSSGVAGTDYFFTSWQRAGNSDYVFGSEGDFAGQASEPSDHAFQLLTLSDTGISDPGVTLGPNEIKQIASITFKSLSSTSTLLALSFDTQILELIGPGDNPIPESQSIASTAASYESQFTVTAVPEPSSLLLLGLGGSAAIGLSARRRRTGRIISVENKQCQFNVH